jgi:negative regulator of replication initiation
MVRRIIQEADMDVTLHIPDELAQRLKAAGGDISRRALEALALDEYKIGHLTADELRRVLSFDAQGDLDAFLTAHGVQHATAQQAETDKAQRIRAAQEAAQAIRQMSRGVRLGGLKSNDLINEGRR